MKRVLIIIFFISGLGFSQVELAIQRGHSSAINQVEFSSSGAYLISCGEKNDAIVWDVAQQKVLTDFKLPELVVITGIKFVEDDSKIKLQSDSTTYFFDLKTDQLISQLADQDSIFRKKDYYLDKDGKQDVFIKKGGIRKGKIGNYFAKYWMSVEYTRADFTAFDISTDRNLIVGVAEDNVIYVNEYEKGKKVTYLKGHNSPAKDVRFSPDGKYFATAGSDRSIIVWNSETFNQEYRLYSNIFKKKTANFSFSGDKIYVGDELGVTYTIDFGLAFPVCQTIVSKQSINKIVKGIHKGAEGYYTANSSNELEFRSKSEKIGQEELISYSLSKPSIKQAKDRFLQKYSGGYQEPFGEVTSVSFSPSKKKILFTGKSNRPNLTFIDLETDKSNHLNSANDDREWRKAEFVTEDSFIGIHVNSGKLYIWKKERSRFYYKTDSLPFLIADFQVVNDSNLWLCSEGNGQYKYNFKTKAYQKVSQYNGEALFKLRNNIVLNSESHDLVFFDMNTAKKGASFKGHTGAVTDVNFHPNRPIFVSSSDDGTIRLWDYYKEEMLATVVPFGNGELVIVTRDNYYLLSKGAFKEIGFRYEGQFFYPDQFDLKYNRPDLVLERLGYSTKEFIGAYKKAYEKRLKKLNFTENDLSTAFHLPKITVTNKSDILNVVDKKKFKLEVDIEDTEILLDRYNVWINEVAIYGANGVSLKDSATRAIHVSLSLILSYGRNKIELSALNAAGAESYKAVINVFCDVGKEKPDAYIVSIGVSEYKNKKYNLAYAAKDALDIENLFIGNRYFGEVSTKVLTDDAVTLENLANIEIFLSKAQVDDVVMIFVAGHGILDENFDYYFASHDINFQNPSKRGIPYEKIEQLLDGIKALKKLLILDTCHSGELDKEEAEESEEKNDEDNGDWNFRNAGLNVSYKENPLGFSSTNSLMKSLFTDLRRGTGATVISSSGGAELAIESSKYKNGLFTYCLIDGLINKKADINNDKSITISELQQYVTLTVREISMGKQVPTSRIQNKELDYRLW